MSPGIPAFLATRKRGLPLSHVSGSGGPGVQARRGHALYLTEGSLVAAITLNPVESESASYLSQQGVFLFLQQRHRGMAESGCAYRPRELAEMLSVSERTMRTWIASGRLKAIRRGRVVMVRRQSLDDFLSTPA